MIIVLFDIDGTLIGGKKYWEQLLYSAIEKATNSSLSNFTYEVSGKTDRQIISELVNFKTEKPDSLNSTSYAKEIYLNYFENNDIAKHFRVLPNVRATLRELSLEGYTLGVVTGNFKKSGTKKLKVKGLSNLFNLDISSFSEDGITRIDLLKSSLEKLHHYNNDSKLEIFYIGDTKNDITSGNKLSLHTIGFGSNTAVKKETNSINTPNLHISSWKKSAQLLEYIKSFCD